MCVALRLMTDNTLSVNTANLLTNTETRQNRCVCLQRPDIHTDSYLLSLKQTLRKDMPGVTDRLNLTNTFTTHALVFMVTKVIFHSKKKKKV